VIYSKDNLSEFNIEGRAGHTIKTGNEISSETSLFIGELRLDGRLNLVFKKTEVRLYTMFNGKI
jgi:hypothetical protein